MQTGHESTNYVLNQRQSVLIGVSLSHREWVQSGVGGKWNCKLGNLQGRRLTHFHHTPLMGCQSHQGVLNITENKVMYAGLIINALQIII